MSPCDTFAERLAEWLPAGADETQPWMAHAEGCTDCAALLAEERAAEARLRAALHAPVPDGLEALIQRRLAEVPVEAPVEPAARAPRTRWLLAAAAALLMAAGWWLRGPVAAPLEATIVEGRGTILPADSRRAVLATGQRVVTRDGRALVRHADALVWLAPHGELVIGALERGEAPTMRLVRGGLDFAVAPGLPFVIDTAYGRLSAADAGGSVRVFGPADEATDTTTEEDIMNVKAIALGLGAVGAAAAIYVAVQSGEVEVSNGAGRATVGAGQAGTAAEGRAPAAIEARVATLEARITELKQARDREKARADRLEARLKVLSPAGDGAGAEAPAGDAPPREVAVVKADVEALIKEHGMQILGLDDDNPLLKELAAMGPAGIELLGDILTTGDATQRFGAAALMSKLLDPSAIPLLEDAVLGGGNDGNLLVQRMASLAVAKIGGEKSVPALERIVSESDEWGVRTNAAFGLAQMGRQSGIDWLRDSFQTADDPMTRMMLLGVMAQVGDPSYLPDLHKVLKEESEYSRRYVAVTGIAKAAREESLPVLEAIINDPSEDKMIIAEARKAYDEIKGQE